MNDIEARKLLAFWRSTQPRWSVTTQLAIGYLLATIAGKPPQNKKLIAECERGLAALRAEMERSAA